nr:hypothetical protein BaRGS_028558 [Batillaria attramentaria]
MNTWKACARRYISRNTYEDWIEVTGNGSDYTAFSTLRSPQFHVQNVSCLRFHFAQTLPSKLTVIVNDQCVFPGVDKQQSDFGLDQVELSPGNITLTLLLNFPS